MFHPATMFFLLTMVVVLLSWIFDIYGLNVIHPQTGENIPVQSLLSPEGIRWWLRNVITNFTGFSPLGMVIVAMFGLGVAEHSGFIHACIRSRTKGKRNTSRIILWVIVLGVLSNLVGDAGYVILLPVAATLFHSAGLHPVAGIVTAYVSVACGYSANIFVTTLDSMLAITTQEAVVSFGLNTGNVGTLSNYYFMFASTLLIIAIIYFITIRKMLPAFGEYDGEIQFDTHKPVSRRERRAISLALVTGVIFLSVILFATFSSWGFLRGISGGLVRSPFIVGILFLLSLCAGLMGMVYGFASGRYRTDADVVDGLTHSVKILGVYLVIAFFAGQMFACLDYTRLDKCLAIMGANLISSVQSGGLWMLLLFILFTSLVNLFMASATAKWAFMAFIFVPLFAQAGIAPEYTQCAFRIGDCATNSITPFLFYMPLVLTYMQRYNVGYTFGSLFKYTWRYSVYIFFFWVILFIFWYLSGLPLGL